MKIRTFEFKKEFTKSISFDLPKGAEFHFETGIRRSVAILPEFYDDEVYSLTFICVYLSFECKIETYNIQVANMENIYNGSSEAKELLEFVIRRDKYTVRTKEQFNADLEQAIEKINKLLTPTD